MYLLLIVEVASVELVKWGNGYETKREQRELENADAFLAACRRFDGRACRSDPHILSEDRAGECASVKERDRNFNDCAGGTSHAGNDRGSQGRAEDAGESVAWNGFVVWVGF